MLDVAAIRREFPILSRQVHGRPLVYLDNAATTQKPRVVIAALREFYETTNANIHRGLHLLAEESTAKYECTREHVARFLNVPQHDPAQIIFTRNATEAINLVAHAWARKFLTRGDEILLTVMEHHSNLVPWFLLAKATGVVLKFVDIDTQGQLRMDQLRRLVTKKTKLVSVTQASNVLGTINPMPEIVREAHAQGALVLVDGAQSVPHFPVDVQALDCDFLAFSAHKMLGPTGVGVLYARKAILETMDPFLGGGEMISKVTLEGATWNELPWKYEAGTPNIGDVVAFDAALTYLEDIGLDAVRAHEERLVTYGLETLSRLSGITLYGPPTATQRTGVISFNVGDLHPHDLGTALDRSGVAVRAGHHCAQPLMRRLGVPATARASFYLYNTEAEIDALAEAIEEAVQFFSQTARRGGRAKASVR